MIHNTLKRIDYFIGGTGHRPPVLFEKDHYSDENRNYLKQFAKNIITMHISIDMGICHKIISGMAQGWDQAISEAAIDMQLPFIAALPFQGMEAKWPKESQNKFNWILSKASEVIIVCEGGYANYKFYERDKWMVDKSDKILALYNGNTTGGTAITVQYAYSINKPVTNIWEDWIKWQSLKSTI